MSVDTSSRGRQVREANSLELANVLVKSKVRGIENENSKQKPQESNASRRRQESANCRVGHERLSQAFGQMLNTACVLGVIPIYWHGSTCTAKLIARKWLVARWIFTLSGITIVTTALAVILIRITARDGFDMTNMYFMYHVLTVGSCYLALFMHFQVAYRRHELVAYINGLGQFWIRVSRWSSGPNRAQQSELWLLRINQIVYYGMFFSSVSGIGTYLFKCKLHLVEDVLPVCWGHDDANPYTWLHEDPVLFVFGALTQFVWIWWQATNLLTLVVAISATIIFSQSVFEELQMGGETSENLRTYRGLQILGQQLNNCFSQDVWPGVLFSLSGVCIIMFSFCIRFEDHFTKVGAFGIFCFLLTLLWGFLDYGPRLDAAAMAYAKEEYGKAKAEERRGGIPAAYSCRVLYSCVNCASFRMRVLTFGYLKKSTVGAVLNMVTQNICAVLIETQPIREIPNY